MLMPNIQSSQEVHTFLTSNESVGQSALHGQIHNALQRGHEHEQTQGPLHHQKVELLAWKEIKKKKVVTICLYA